MKRKLMSFLLCLCMAAMLLPAGAFAAEGERVPTRKARLDLSLYTETTDMLESEGWKWEPGTGGGTLTLRNCYIQSDDCLLLCFLNNSAVTIVLEGENTLETTANVLGAMISDKGAASSIDLTIREGAGGGSLNILCSAEMQDGQNAYGIAGNSITIESGTVVTNTDFCIIGGDFTMTGGALQINAPAPDSYGIYTNMGNVVIDDGSVDIKVGNTGIWTVGINADPNGSRNVHINGGTVKIEAGVSGIQTFNRGNLNDTCNVYISGGDVDITSKGMGIAAKDIIVDTDGKVKVQGSIAALYINEAGVKGIIELKRAEELVLTGEKITFPEKSTDDGLKEVVIGKANYTAVDAALAKAEALNESDYLDFSAVTAAVNGVDNTKNILQQADVNKMAQNILDAISALKYKPADYSRVNAAIEKANGLSKYEYKDFSAVEEAIKAVVWDQTIDRQADVNAMAEAIEGAIASLQYKPADYSKVDAAVGKAKGLDENEYKNFSAVEEAINAVVRDLTINKQADVDAMAKAIEEAIALLEYKPADYSKVDAAIEKAEALYKDDYKDFSKVEEAIKAVVRDKNITKQGEVDAMARAIEDALSRLEKKEDKPDTPQTGDNTSLTLWMILILASGSALTGAAVYSRKRRYNQ